MKKRLVFVTNYEHVTISVTQTRCTKHLNESATMSYQLGVLNRGGDGGGGDGDDDDGDGGGGGDDCGDSAMYHQSSTYLSNVDTLLIMLI